jgi:hypothetical protein
MKTQPFKLAEFESEPYADRGLFFSYVFEVEPRCFETLLALVPYCPPDVLIDESTVPINVVPKLAEWSAMWHLTDN